jgi:hypothetical protein
MPQDEVAQRADLLDRGFSTRTRMPAARRIADRRVRRLDGLSALAGPMGRMTERKRRWPPGPMPEMRWRNASISSWKDCGWVSSVRVQGGRLRAAAGNTSGRAGSLARTQPFRAAAVVAAAFCAAAPRRGLAMHGMLVQDRVGDRGRSDAGRGAEAPTAAQARAPRLLRHDCEPGTPVGA